MSRLVLDTNCLIQIVSPRSKYHALWESFVKTILNSKFTQVITPYYNFNLIEADKDDNKFVDCAIAAQAKCIVTNDHHYDVLKTIPFPKVEVVGLVEFMEMSGI